MATDDDEVWRAIVDNYGDRPDLDLDEPEAAPTSEPLPDPTPAEDPYDAGWGEAQRAVHEAGERFVPPPPPPVPRASADRVAAWTGVFGSPVVLLICLIFSIPLPQLLAYLLVIGFVGGFLYLVIQMPREPRDPGDDGAVI